MKKAIALALIGLAIGTWGVGARAVTTCGLVKARGGGSRNAAGDQPSPNPLKQAMEASTMPSELPRSWYCWRR